MPGNPREIITLAERRFPVRIRIGAPPDGVGQRHTQMTAWLDENCGANGWAMTPSGTRGVLSDAVIVTTTLPARRARRANPVPRGHPQAPPWSRRSSI
jgi:hypothetical protein